MGGLVLPRLVQNPLVVDSQVIEVIFNGGGGGGGGVAEKARLLMCVDVFIRISHPC
jgi:hypothetical protein